MSEFTDSDYEALEVAVMETPRGRWFLGEYARRARAADTQVLLAAIRKLERGMAGLIQPGDAGDFVNEIDAVSQALSAAVADVAALQDGPAAPDGAHAKSENVETTRLGRDLAELAQALEGFAEALGPADAESVDPTVLEEAAGELFRLSQTQEAFCRRTAKLKEDLVQLKARLGALVAAERPRTRSELSTENLSYFEGDEDLFESAADAGGSGTVAAPSLSLVDSGPQDDRPEQPSEHVTMAAPAGPDKERVVFIRRASSEQTSIPLADEPSDEQADSRPARGG